MNKILKIKCPKCANVFNYYDSEWRPFCSERCKMVDLGHWFEETYKVPDREKNNNDKMKDDSFSEEKNNTEIKQEQVDYYGDEYTQIDSSDEEEGDY